MKHLQQMIWLWLAPIIIVACEGEDLRRSFWLRARYAGIRFDINLLQKSSVTFDNARLAVEKEISSCLNEAGFLSADIVAFRHPSGSFSSVFADAGSIFFAKLTFNQVHDRSTIIQLFRARSEILLLSLSDREMIFEDEITRQNVEQALIQLESRQNNCQNGGVQLQDNTCACPNYFTGDFCEQRVCLNGGYTIASYPRCVCPPGYHGLHCEPLPCSPATQFTFDFQQKTLVVVFEARDSMAIDLQGLISALSSVTNFFQTNHTGYYDSYQITTVVQPDNDPATMRHTFWYRSSSDFLSSLQNVVLLLGTCSQPILTGILDAIQHSPYTHAKSPYFIFVDALASDIDLEEQVRTAALAWGVQLFFVTSQLQSSGCSLDIGDPGFQVYLNLARATQGEVIQLQYNKADVESLINLIVPLLYQETTIAAANYAACPADGKSDNFTVDSSATELLIFSTGGAILLSNGSQLSPQNISGDLNIFSLPTSTNNVEVHSVSSGNCGYRVFVQSTNSILVSYTPNPSIDSYSTIMTAGLPFSAVARSTTVPLPTNLSLAFFNDDDETPLFTPDFSLTMQRSTDCIFPTLFQAWPSCVPGPLNVKLYAQVPGIGSIERVYPGYCHDFQLVPTTTASPITCQNGGTPLAHACGCPQYFGGKFCEVIQCINGGIMKYAPDGTSYCSCQLGYTGLHCEMLTCNETSSSVLGGSTDATHRDLSVVILNRISMASYQSEWRYGFENFTGWYDANQPNYFDNYYITTFIAKANSSGFVYNIINKLPFTTSAAFRSQIRGLGLTVSTVTTGQPVLSAIQRTIVDDSGNVAIKKRSPMFVFVDDEPSDVYLLRDLELLVVQSQVQLFIIVTSQYASTTTCGIAASGTGQVVYSQLAAISGGLFVNFCNSPLNIPITKTLSALGPILYQLETMTQLDAPDCSTGITDSFGIGNQQTYYIITTSENTPNVSLYNLDSKQTTVPTAGLHIGNFYLFSLNELPLGTYSITMVSAGQCHFKVAGSSSISAFYGFATSGFDITTTYAQLGSQLHPVVHLSGLTPAPELTIQIYGQYNAQIGGGAVFYLGSSVYRGNSNCSYELYFPGQWECTAPYQYFYIKFLVSDASKTQRTMTGYCMGLQPQECVNGGAFNPVIAGCQCHAPWTGIFCQTPLCFNSGTLVPQDQSCSCVQGYTGIHCEYVSCPVKNNFVAGEPAQFEYKSVAFVIDMTLNGAGIDQFVADNIGQFLQFTASTEKQYTLVTYDESSVYDIITTSDANLYQNVTENTLRPSDLRQEAHKLNHNQFDTVPDVLSFEGLLQALELVNVQPAIVYVFATGLPYVNFSDSNSAHTYDRVFALLENQQIQVNFIIGGFHADILTGPAAEDMQKVATFTSGRTIYTGNFFGAPGQFANLIAQYLPLTVQENGFLVEHIVADCTTATVAYVPIDSKSDWFSLIIIGSQMTVTLYDADGNLYQQNASEIITNDKEAAMILRIFNSNKPSFVGFWRVSITTKSGGCTLQARVASSIQVNYGFSLSISADTTIPQPFSGSNVSNVVLANLPQSLQQTNFQLSYFEVLSYNFSSGHGDAQAVLRFKPRDTSCAYQYYSEPFSCPSSAFALKITGQDADGMPFQRIAAAYCNQPSCQNNGTLTSDGACLCDSLWTGFECNLPICLNGGTLDVSICNCATGYYGVHCENTVTAPTTPPFTGSTTAPPPYTGSTTAPPVTSAFTNPIISTAAETMTYTDITSVSKTSSAFTGSITRSATDTVTYTASASAAPTTAFTGTLISALTTAIAPTASSVTTRLTMPTTTTTAHTTTTTTPVPTSTTTTSTTTTTTAPTTTTTTILPTTTTTTTTTTRTTTTTLPTTTTTTRTTTPTTSSLPTTENANCDTLKLKMDMIFMVDASTSAGTDGLDKESDILISLISSYTIGSSSTQAIVDPYYDSVDTSIYGQLNSWTSNAALTYFIDVIVRKQYHGRPFQYTSGLQAVVDMQLGVSNGERGGVQHVIIIFSMAATAQSDINSAQSITARIRSQGGDLRVAIWGIALESDPQLINQLTALAGGSQCIYVPPGGISNQQGIINWIKEQSCLNTFCA